MSILVPSLQKLNFQDTDDETVLPFEDFIKFLRQNLTDKNIRVDNIKVELSNKNELTKIAGKIFVTFQGIIVYTASHINDYAICKRSFQDICNILCGKNSTPICSTLELYKVIAKLNISMPSSSTYLDEDFYKPFTMTTNQTLMKMNGIKSAGSNASFKENIQKFLTLKKH